MEEMDNQPDIIGDLLDFVIHENISSFTCKDDLIDYIRDKFDELFSDY